MIPDGADDWMLTCILIAAVSTLLVQRLLTHRRARREPAPGAA